MAYFTKSGDKKTYTCEIKHPQSIGKEIRTNALAFDASKILADAELKKIVDCGLIVAKDSVTGLYVPYDSTGSNGSNLAVGVLDTILDCTMHNPIVSLVMVGVLIEDKLYILDGEDKLAITEDVKTDLNKIIFWRQ